MGLLASARGSKVVRTEEAGAVMMLVLEVGRLAMYMVYMCTALWPLYAEQEDDKMSVSSSQDGSDDEEESDEDDDWSQGSESSIWEETFEQVELRMGEAQVGLGIVYTPRQKYSL